MELGDVCMVDVCNSHSSVKGTYASQPVAWRLCYLVPCLAFPPSILPPTPYTFLPLVPISLFFFHLFFVCVYRNCFLVLNHYLGISSSSLYHQSNPWVFYSRRKLPQFMPHHILRDGHIMIDLAIVHLEFQPHEIGQDGRGACLGFDGCLAFAGFGAYDGKALGM